MKKKILTAVLLFAVAFTICGCYARVKDRNELIKYANETYGEAKFLGSEKKLKGKESFTTILMADQETGFNYSVTSKLVDEIGDGKPSSYVVKIESDFEEKYFLILTNEAVFDIDPVASAYGFHYNCVDDVVRIDFLGSVDETTIEEALSQFDRILAGYDTRGLRPNEYHVYNVSGDFIGTYDAGLEVFTGVDIEPDFEDTDI